MPIERVLIIDDEDDIRTLVAISLSRVGGWAVSLAADGETGLRLAQTERPDVILLDQRMPELDGAELLARLQADPRTAGLPVIFLTAKVHRGDQAPWIALGAIGAIAKPFDPMGLPAQIRALVEGVSGGPPCRP